jgi:hypothetical protein
MVEIFNIGTVTNSDTISIVNHEDSFEFSSKKYIRNLGQTPPSYWIKKQMTENR